MLVSKDFILKQLKLSEVSLDENLVGLGALLSIFSVSPQYRGIPFVAACDLISYAVRRGSYNLFFDRQGLLVGATIWIVSSEQQLKKFLTTGHLPNDDEFDIFDSALVVWTAGWEHGINQIIPSTLAAIPSAANTVFYLRRRSNRLLLKKVSRRRATDRFANRSKDSIKTADDQDVWSSKVTAYVTTGLQSEAKYNLLEFATLGEIVQSLTIPTLWRRTSFFILTTMLLQGIRRQQIEVVSSTSGQMAAVLVWAWVPDAEDSNHIHSPNTLTYAGAWYEGHVLRIILAEGPESSTVPMICDLLAKNASLSSALSKRLVRIGDTELGILEALENPEQLVSAVRMLKIT